MRLLDKFRNWFQKTNAGKATEDNKPLWPLREFIYLDEVSLRSLLSSQVGEVTDQVSEQVVDALQSELTGTLAANSPLIGKAELTSSYQTSNSSTLQTSRKALVQSWFRDFHSKKELRLVTPPPIVGAFRDQQELTDCLDKSIALKSSELSRGSLVEYRVKLTADPVFHLGTMVSEFTAMANDYPDMFRTANTLSSLREAQPINKILQRLLAGLIPIKGEAIDYKVVTVDGVEYVVHKNAIADLSLDGKPLEIVGVTEHLAYWKDIRRVLFSEAEFTVLCRIARSDLQLSWTPVKLADLFREVAPNLVDQINAASRLPVGDSQRVKVMNVNESKLIAALRSYMKDLLSQAGVELSDEQVTLAEVAILSWRSRASSASDQRSAFQAVRSLIEQLSASQIDISAEQDLELRNRARVLSGLSLFPSLSKSSPVVPGTHSSIDDERTHPRMLDVEVVAIYW